MYLSFALVKNLRSSATELIFSNFSLRNIKHGNTLLLSRARELFPGDNVCYGDWIYERHYESFTDDQLSNIFFETEDILLSLRLYKVGDLVFLQLGLKKPDGSCKPPHYSTPNSVFSRCLASSCFYLILRIAKAYHINT